MTVWGYLRVSTDQGQTTENQRLALAGTGFAIDKFVSEDGVSGSVNAIERPAFSKMLSEMEAGDCCIVVAIDRLGRNAYDVLGVIEEFKRRSIKLRVAQFDGVDLTSPTGKLLVTVMAALAEMERATLITRVNAGIARTRAQGTKFGRPLTIPPDTLAELVETRKKGWTLLRMQEHYGIPKNSIDRNVKQWGDDLEGYRSEWAAREAQYKNREVVR